LFSTTGDNTRNKSVFFLAGAATMTFTALLKRPNYLTVKTTSLWRLTMAVLGLSVCGASGGMALGSLGAFSRVPQLLWERRP